MILYNLFPLHNASYFDTYEKYLKRFGFKVCKIVPTGIHPERIPFVQKNHISPDKLTFKMLKILMKLKKNGDTYEVYCQKISGITDEQ